MRTDEDDDKSKDEHQYLCYCIPAGLLIGTLIGVLASLPIGMCSAIGMLIGIAVGATIDYEIKKRKSDE